MLALMTNDSSIAIASRPNFWGWILALLSLLLIIVLSATSLLFSYYLRQEYIYQEFLFNLNKRQYLEINNLISDIFSPPRLYRLIPLHQLLNDTALLSTKAAIAKELVGAASAIEAQELQVADNRLETAFQIKQDDQRIIQIQSLLKKLKLLSETIILHDSEIQKLESRKLAIISEQDLLAHDFADIFGLEAELPEKEDQFLENYKLGVLAGLPKILKLRDNIGDLDRLKTELESLHAKIIYTGEDAHMQFTEKLESLRVAGNSATARQHEVTTLLESNTKLLQASRDEYDQVKLSCLNNIADNLRQLVKPAYNQLPYMLHTALMNYKAFK